MPVKDYRAETRAFLNKFFQGIELKDDEDFFALGFINSLFAMQLVLFVEKETGVALENEELALDNFKSIDALVSLIERKLATNVKG